MLLVIDAEGEPADVRRAVVSALTAAGMGVEAVVPPHIAHGATITYELAVRSEAQRSAARTPREPAESPQETPEADEPTEGALDPDELPGGRRRRGLAPRPGDVYRELGLETRPAAKPRPERKPPAGGRGTTAHVAPPMRSPRSEGLEPPDRERLRDRSGSGLGVVGQSPFDD